MTTPLEILAEKCDLLLAENDALRERVIQLEQALTGGYDRIPIAGITATEAAVLATIAGNEAGVRKEAIFNALYALRGAGEVPEIKIVDVYVCKLRKKLADRGLRIETVWGWGYRMPAESRETLEQLREAIS